MNINATRRKLADDADALASAEQLLLRYPEVSTDEQGEIARFLTRATVMDMGLLSTNAAAWAKAEQFRADHRSIFALSALGYAAWIVAALVACAILISLWDSGLNV